MFEFEAEVQDGRIMIPDEYRSSLPNGTIVKITVSCSKQTRDESQCALRPDGESG
jgi:hypothetical protein